MALTFADRVRETTTTAGTGTLDLDGPVDTYQGFVAGVGDAATVVYVIVHRTANEWEVGEGTVTDAAPDTLSRDTVRDGSNGSSAVNFSAGTKDVYLTMGASDIESDLQADVDETITGAWDFTGTPVEISDQNDSTPVTPLILRGNRANPADNDALRVDWTLHDSGGNDEVYARMDTLAIDVSDATEDGQFRLWVVGGGSLTQVFRADDGQVVFNDEGDNRIFRVENSADANAISLEDSASSLGIFKAPDSGGTWQLDVGGTIRTSGVVQFGAEMDLAEITTPSNPAAGNNKLYFKSDDNLYKLDSDGNESQVGGGGGGSAVILDLGDDGANESSDLGEIATTGDTNSIFSEPTADKLLIDASLNWPTADNVVEANVDHDALLNFVANEHIDHSAVSIDPGTGLSGGGDITTTRTLALSHLGLESLVDPNADRIIFWDDSAGNTDWLTVGTGLSISTTTLATDDGAIDHDALLNFVADEHVAHSGVTLTAGNGLTGGGDITANRTFAIATDGVAVDELDLSIAPTWTGLHTFGAGLALLDDDQLQFGTGTDYWLEYDATGTQLRLRTTDADGGGTDGTVMSIQDGTDDVVFEGAVTSKAAGDSFLLPVGTDQFAT